VVAPPHGIAAALRRHRIVIDAALDLTADGLLWPETLSSLRAGGRVCVVTNVTAKSVSVLGKQVIQRELELIGSGSASPRDLEAALDLLVHGVVKPEIGAIMPLSHAADAHRMVEERHVLGRVVLRPAWIRKRGRPSNRLARPRA
jgi:D-arabinose 1-dehydrogenase-like Zn-dependent alcohol dehydrogenase